MIRGPIGLTTFDRASQSPAAHPVGSAARRLLCGITLAASLATFQPVVALADAGFGPDAPADVAGATASAPAASNAAYVASPLEAALFAAVNGDRAQYGLPPVEFDASLLPVARARADAQKPQPSLNHYDPDGRLAFVKLLAADNVDYVLAGENLARLNGPDDATVVRAEDALMHSPTHRANILEPSFNRMAIGASFDGNGRVIFAQIFRNKAA